MIFKEAYIESITEASNTIQAKVVKNNKEVEKLCHNYRTAEQQKIVQDSIFKTLNLGSKENKFILDKIKKSGIDNAKNFKEFSSIYNKKFFTNELLPYISGFISLVPNAKGYGKGELFFAFLNPNIVINGGAGSFDLALNGDEAEVKEVKYKIKNGKGILYNFKFGTENASKEAIIRKIAQKYIKQYLYSIPKEEWPANAEEKLEKGELNALISLVKKYENKLKNVPTDIEVTVKSNGDVIENGNTIGNIFNPTFQQKIKEILSNTKKLTYTDIVAKAQELFSKSNRSYLFIVGQQTTMKNLGKICYKEKLGKDILPLDFTQGKVKIGVLCSNF